MITIKKSPTADTRTCDWSKVSLETLLKSSESHIEDVTEGLKFFSQKLRDSAYNHDVDKISEIEWFHKDFQTGFKETGWWDNHRKVNRHHLNMKDGVPEDVNLVDVLDYITDCVMAGMARSGSVYEVVIDPEVLMNAFKNTVELLKNEIKVED